MYTFSHQPNIHSFSRVKNFKKPKIKLFSITENIILSFSYSDYWVEDYFKENEKVSWKCCQKWIEKFRLSKEGDQLGGYNCNPDKCWLGLLWHGGSWKGEMEIAIKDILKEEITSLADCLKIGHGRKRSLKDNSKILELETWGIEGAINW